MSQPDTEWAIDLKNVSKIYKGKVHALQGIETRVRRGEVFGLLGSNGAGKSTLVKIMMTVVRPTRAEGTLLGQPVGHKPTLKRVGYLPENHRFPRYLTGRQTLEFFGALSKVDRRTRKRRGAELLEIVGMTDWGDRKISTYSKGMMQRIGLAQALVADPDLVLLDEPTDGVDPVGRRDIRAVLLRMRDEGKTVFINSHLLSELEMLCTRVAILVRGQVAKQGTIEELTQAQQRYEIDIAHADGVAAARQRVKLALPDVQWKQIDIAAPPALPGQAVAQPAFLDRGALGNGTWVEFDGTTLRLGTTEPADIQPVLDAFRREGLTIRRVAPFRQSLEELFMETVTDPTTGRAMTPGAARGPGFPVKFAAAMPTGFPPSSPQFPAGGQR